MTQTDVKHSSQVNVDIIDSHSSQILATPTPTKARHTRHRTQHELTSPRGTPLLEQNDQTAGWGAAADVNQTTEQTSPVARKTPRLQTQLTHQVSLKSPRDF